jgi:hypothetical protein
MHRALVAFTLTSMMWLGACSSAKKPEAKIFAAGEKASTGPLTYAVVDTQIYPQLGDDLATARTPVNRFYVVQISVSNSSNADLPIPPLTLVDDSGKTYTELSDGTGVNNWLGLIRKVEGGGTQLGSIVFDAPSKHYRLRFTDELDPAEIAIDLPLNFVHEQIGDVKTTTDFSPPAAPDAPSPASPKK